MGVRVGTSQFMYNYIASLNNSYQKQQKLFEQADGSRLHRGSDDPMGYAKLLRYNVNESENTQYQENIKTAGSWMKNSDDVMIHMTEIMQTLKEKSVHAANSDNAEDDYAAIYKEMFSNMQELVSVANSQLSDRYLFSGQKDLTKPFILSNDLYERGVPKTLDSAQASFFKGTTGDFNAQLYQMLELEKDGETYYLDTENGNIYTKQFLLEDYKEVIALGCSTIDAAQASDNSKVQSALSKGIAEVGDGVSDDGEPAVRVADYFTNQGRPIGDGTYGDYNFVTIKQRIVTYNGDENLISMVKLNGNTDPSADTVNSTGARMFGRDIFDNDASGNEPSGTAMLNELFCVCEKVNSCDIHWMSEDGVGITDVAHATLVIEETRIGARQQLYTSVNAMLENQSENITEDITNVSGTDVAALATKLMQMTTLYNLSLSMGGRILPQSLADYL